MGSLFPFLLMVASIISFVPTLRCEEEPKEENNEARYFQPSPYPGYIFDNNPWSWNAFPRQMIQQQMPLLQTPSSLYHRMIQSVDPLAYLQVKLEDVIKGEARDQSALMAETYLSMFDTSCIQKSFCEVAVTSRDGGIFDEEATTAAEMSVNVMKKMLEETREEYKAQFGNTQSLLGAFEVGQKTQNFTMCKWLFPCEEAAMATNRNARITCSNTGELCPGYSISCALCALFLPETCGFVCPIAGIYCGVAGYACADEKQVDPPADEEEPEEPVTTRADDTMMDRVDNFEAQDDVEKEEILLEAHLSGEGSKIKTNN